MDRRAFLACTSALLAAPLVAEAQRSKPLPRVAWLGNGSISTSGRALDSFRAGLRELGYVEGQSIVIESRFLLNTAKALGLTVPPSLLRRADEIVQ